MCRTEYRSEMVRVFRARKSLQGLQMLSFGTRWRVDDHGSSASLPYRPAACLFLSCKAYARVKPAKTGHGLHSSQIVLFYILFVCRCVLYYCQRMSTQMQLTNISINLYLSITNIDDV